MAETMNWNRNAGEQPILPYPGRFAGYLLLLSLPLGAILGGFAANTDVSPSTALICWLGLSGLFAIVLRQLLSHQWRVRNESVREVRETADARAAADDAALRAVLDGLQMPVMLFDEDRRIRFLNLSSRDLLGPASPGKDFATAIRNPEILAAIARVIRSGSGETVEFRIRHPVNRLLRARIESLPAPPSGPRTFIVMLDDMTDTERLREVRSDFVADVSHELRTPLASVLSIVETLNGAARNDPEAQKRFLAILDEQARRMARIVDDLLSLSRIEMNEHRPPSGIADLRDVISGVVDSGRLIAQEREVQIEVDIPDPILVAGDAHELSRLFQNLVDNAVKYGDPGSTVRVKGLARDNAALVSVADCGGGIPREHIPRLTERFYRVDKGRSRAAGGTGLGLAIVKHVVNRHRGRLRIELVEGEGSTFTVELPLAPG
ncbi:MAG: ATP-binding protein [Minwuia sp.]|uniref:ATP-binding protein n=1 Tax=Minwuia sp. TaxID=2493630 RepID=UPI003A8B05E8